MTATTYAMTMETNRPANIPWAKMPMWFHAATIVYFATNIINGWGLVAAKAPVGAIALGWFGLIGGFIEHISPYFPKLYVHPTLEKILFRAPTILAILWLGWALGLAWYMMAFVVVQGVIFLRENPLTSMEPRFHVQHVFGTHIMGAVQIGMLVLVSRGTFPLLNSILVG